MEVMQPVAPFNPMPTPPSDDTQPEIPAMPPPVAGVPMTPPQAATAAAEVAPAAAEVAAPPMADDGDLIEKEWVHKVKQVVHGTAHDPYEQNRQFTKLKADYMQKRYGKSIKLDE